PAVVDRTVGGEDAERTVPGAGDQPFHGGADAGDRCRGDWGVSGLGGVLTLKHYPLSVMAGLDPAIRRGTVLAGMAGSSPAMTLGVGVRYIHVPTLQRRRLLASARPAHAGAGTAGGCQGEEGISPDAGRGGGRNRNAAG